jgi:hypothetical protein
MAGSNVLSCPACGWWIGGQYITDGGGRGWTVKELYIGLLQRYALASAKLPTETLRTALKKSPALIYEVHPRKMEELVGSVFRDFYNCEVRHVGRTGDGGVDLLLVESDNSVIVQVKRRMSQNASEGVSLIREVVGATLLSGHRRAIVVTTGRFTRGSKKVSHGAVEQGVLERLELIDISQFIEILGLTSRKVEPAWQRALKGRIFGVEGAGYICKDCSGHGGTGWDKLPATFVDGVVVERNIWRACNTCKGSGRVR